MRFFNNTRYQTIPAQDLLNDIAHLLITLDKNAIESIEMNDDKITVFGVECILLEHSFSQPLTCTGEIRWFDALSGYGQMRLPNGNSIHFYSCNVHGADSCYPELVSNVSFERGDKVQFEISSDQYLFNNCGATNIRKAV